MSEHTFDPEVVALLREVARDSGSTLLRLPKEPLVRWVGRPEEVISPQGSHLTKVEKHLVEAYREEAAWVLLQACLAQLKRLPLVFSSGTQDSSLLRSSAKRLVKNEDTSLQGQADLALIADGQEPSALQLGLSSVRLSPNDFGRNVLAIALERSERRTGSMHLLRRILAGEPCMSQRAQAFENMAQLWAMRKDYARSFECSLSAAQADESKIRLVTWCLTTALQAGDEARAREFSERLERHPSIHQLRVVTRALIDGRTSGQWNPTPSSRRLAARLREEVAEPVREICDVFS